MFPSWLVIGFIALLISLIINQTTVDDLRWFFRLKRPQWLTFEFLIPFIWTFIFVCVVLSASVIWDSNISLIKKSIFMTIYLVLELLIFSYTRVMCALRSLLVGTIIGGVGVIVGLILATLVYGVNASAFYLLIPYLLWSPIGTYVTWAMIPLNRESM